MATSVKHRGFKWTVGDASNPALAILVDETSQSLHVSSPTDADTDWDVAAYSHPTVSIHSNTTPATDYITLWHDATYGYFNVASGTLALQVDGTSVALLASTGLTALDDALLAVGTGSTARFSWDTTDANSNQMLLQLPAAGSVDSPVLVIGQSIESVDLGAATAGADYNAVVDPRIAIFSSGAVATGPVIEFRKARGTTAAPTVCTTADDIGTIDFYGAVANGEYVRGASIRADIAGTIATTRGPATLTFLTATDAAPSVLTTALTISAAQLVTCAAGITVTTGTVTITAGNLSFTDASDILIKAASAAALEISDATTKFYAIDTRVTTVGVTTHTFSISNYTLASAAGAVATGLSIAAHTLNLTGNTQVTSAANTASIGARTIAGAEAITVDQANSLTIVAPTEGTNVTLTAASAIRVTNAGGTPTNQYGIYIADLTAGATSDYGIYIAGADTAAIYVASADPIHLGVAGTTTGKMEFDGSGSGTVTLTVAATAGTWTMTLPAAVGGAGEQLTDAAANGICSWAAAASLREYKAVEGLADPDAALAAMLATPVYNFHYRPDAKSSTRDFDTLYTGPVAEEAPWAMHYRGGIVNPVNTLGYSILAVQALDARIKALEGRAFKH